MAAPTPYSSSPITSYILSAGTPTDINAFLSGTKWGDQGIGTGATVYYSFPVSNSASLWDQRRDAYSFEPGYETYAGFQGLDSNQQAAATTALESWANVANINFVKVDTETSLAVGDIRVAITGDGYMDANTYAYAYFPGPSYGGDVWINATQPVPTGNDYGIGKNGYYTILHELGHALGLSHPFDNTYSLSDTSLDTLQYSVMSYSDAPLHPDTGYSSLYPTTPMLLDIQAIQHIYGANTSYHSGDDTYIFSDLPYYETIWDAGGTDTIQYTGNNAATINLNAGSFSILGSPISLSNGIKQKANVAIAYNVTIENATGGNGNDKIYGNEANNHLDGGSGIDELKGGKGDDQYTVDLIQAGSTPSKYKVKLQDTVSEASNAGDDTLVLRGSFNHLNASSIKLDPNLEHLDASATGATKLNLTGNASSNIITGNDADNIINGKSGSDSLIGGLGDDSYLVKLIYAGTGPTKTAVLQDSITELSSEGIDSLILRGNLSKLKLPSEIALTGELANIENLDISATTSAMLNIAGNDADNILIGNNDANTLTGLAGNDTLDGKKGADTMIGGTGDDLYFIDNKKDVVTELVGEGNDTINSKFSYDLSNTANVENLTLLGSAAINATGDSNSNTLTGNSNNNILDGGAGADSMIGGKGNDTYFVDDVNDTAFEATDEGSDSVQSSVDFTLGANLEKLQLTGTAKINGTGNGLNNTIIGNAGNNIIDGADGVDKLKGGKGDDQYTVDLIQAGSTPSKYKVKLQDTVSEASNAGDDTLVLRGSFNHLNASSIKLDPNLEHLDASATGATKLNLTGNASSNIITGNDADNIINGKSGSDSLIGGLGDDSYLVKLIYAGTGPTKTAVLQDSITELSSEGIDSLILRGNLSKLKLPSEIALTGELANIENLDISATTSAMLNIAGNDADNILIGNNDANTLTGLAGNDTLDGKKGADTMIGGTGNDTYYVDNKNDVVIEGVDEGNDTIFSTVSFNLSTNGSNVEDLTLFGKDNLNVIGNNIDNDITGNDGDNKIDGSAGNDVLAGQAGNDTLIGGLGNDTLFGATGDDSLFGGDGNDELYAGPGRDMLDGGAGDDVLVAGSGNDVLTGGLGADTFLWSNGDHGTYKKASVDKITDFNLTENDILDFQFLLIGESESADNLLNYLDFSTSTKSGITSTEIRISTEGNFINGIYAANAEKAHIQLTGVDLFNATGVGTEDALIQGLITSGNLIVSA